MSKAKYHHLVPQTYMTPWANDSGTLKVFFQGEKKIVERNKSKLGGKNYYYSISAGMPLCTVEDTKKIFKSLENFEVKINNQIVNDTLEMNRHFDDFSKWEILKEEGRTVSNKKMKNIINNEKINYIEDMWSRSYENNWNKLRDKLISSTKTNQPDIITEEEFYGIVKFIVHLEWRTNSNEKFNLIFDKIWENIFDEEKIVFPENQKSSKNYIKSGYDEIKHNTSLNQYRGLQTKSGSLYIEIENIKHNVTMYIFEAKEKLEFITSDNPVINYMGNKIMAISPKILIVLAKKINNQPVILKEVDDSIVRNINTLIIQKFSEYIIIPRSHYVDNI